MEQNWFGIIKKCSAQSYRHFWRYWAT